MSDDKTPATKPEPKPTDELSVSEDVLAIAGEPPEEELTEEEKLSAKVGDLILNQLVTGKIDLDEEENDQEDTSQDQTDPMTPTPKSTTWDEEDAARQEKIRDRKSSEDDTKQALLLGGVSAEDVVKKMFSEGD